MTGERRGAKVPVQFVHAVGEKRAIQKLVESQKQLITEYEADLNAELGRREIAERKLSVLRGACRKAASILTGVADEPGHGPVYVT